jgi:hypothetical protein
MRRPIEPRRLPADILSPCYGAASIAEFGFGSRPDRLWLRETSVIAVPDVGIERHLPGRHRPHPPLQRVVATKPAMILQATSTENGVVRKPLNTAREGLTAVPLPPAGWVGTRSMAVTARDRLVEPASPSLQLVAPGDRDRERYSTYCSLRVFGSD